MKKLILFNCLLVLLLSGCANHEKYNVFGIYLAIDSEDLSEMDDQKLQNILQKAISKASVPKGIIFVYDVPFSSLAEIKDFKKVMTTIVDARYERIVTYDQEKYQFCFSDYIIE